MADDEPHWLDPEEQDAWRAMAQMLTRLPAALDADLQRHCGISFFEYMVLSGLSMTPERSMRMSEVAEFAASSLSRLSHTARRLESKGWLVRKPDPTDGRFTLAILTEAGWQKVSETAPRHVSEVRRLLITPLTKAQYKHLRQISDRINDAIGDEPCLGGPTPANC